MPADLQQVRAVVEALLQDAVRLDRMSAMEHLQWARALPFCADPQAPEYLRAALARILAMSAEELHDRRAAAKEHWTERKRVLDPAWEVQYRCLPDHIRSVLGPKKNLLLLKELLVAAGSPDELLFDHLLSGFPLIGELYRSGTLPAVPYTGMEESSESLWQKRATNNAYMKHRVLTSTGAGSSLHREFLDKNQEEVLNGKATWVPSSEALEDAVVTPRFAVHEGYKWDALGEWWRLKIRMIDDYLASRVNMATSVGEKIEHDTLDVLVSLARQIGSAELKFRKADFVGAFKTLPLRCADLHLAVSILMGENADLLALQLWSCPFGALSSVHSWHRFGAAIQLILANLFDIPYPRYVDDLFGVDPTPMRPREYVWQCASGTARLAKWVIQELLGWELDEDKAKQNSQQFRALGVDVECDEATDTLRFEIGQDRIQKWTAEINEILFSCWCSPSRASKLAGKLSWGASAVFGRGARVYLMPLFYHASGRSKVVSRRMMAALQWWLRYLEARPVRIVSLLQWQRPRLLLYTDATGSGNMAWVAEVGSHRLYSRTVVPTSLRKWARFRKNQIATWELAAAICGLWYFLAGPQQLDPGAEIQMFVDSTVALGTLMRGCSRQKDWNAMVADIWFRTAVCSHLLLCWRVPSAQNLADAPTRAADKRVQMIQLQEAGFEEVLWQWPRQVPWR